MKRFRWMMGMMIAVCVMAAGCGTKAAPAETAAAGTAEASAPEETSAPEATVAEETEPAVIPEDGEYLASVDTDSSMFHLNEAVEGRGRLTVEGGQMTVHITLASTGIVNLYYGTADEAKADEAGWIDHTEDEVTYRDGMKEVVYGFDVPVPSLDREYAVAILGTKGTWYDHTIRVYDPQAEE